MSHVLEAWFRLQAMLAKEFRLLLRDPRMRFFVIVPPLLQMVVFGYASTFDVRYAAVGVVDEARGAASRALLDAVASGGHYALMRFDDMRAAGDAMTRGRVRAIIHLPANFDADAHVQIIADGADPNSAQLVLGQLAQIARAASLQATGRMPALQLEERAWYNPNLDDRWYFVPGIIANVVMIATIMLTAMTVVRERELGTLERLMVTPIGRMEFLLGKMIPVALVGLFDVALVTLVAVAWFEVPFRGSLLALFAGSTLFLMSTLGLGLLLSTYSRSQQQAMLLAVFIIMPAVILSGFAFPIRNMPEVVQWLTWVDPLRYYLVVIRDLFLKGGGIGAHLQEFASMAILGAVALGLSALRLR
ncbi:MAG: ABC transporter permease [Thiohalomonadaceae bacterium]